MSEVSPNDRLSEPARQHRWVLVCVSLIIIAAFTLPLLFALMRRLGLPFGLRIVPMGEDYNWMLILSGESMSRKAQNFWAMNDRNPLSPWWYIAFERIYRGFPNGPYLTRLLMQPLLGLSAFAMIYAATGGRARALALGVGLLAGGSIFGGGVDQIHWNFLGALSLSMLSVAVFAIWINGGRRSAVWYGASLVLWYCAFSSYTFQVGAIIGIAFLAVARPPAAASPLQRLMAAGLEVAPYLAIFIAFLLAWRTTQNPAMAGYYSLQPGLLLENLPRSLQVGVSLDRYYPFALAAWRRLSWWLPLLCVAFGAFTFVAHAVGSRGSELRAADTAVAFLVGFGLVIPTALIESMSPTWTVGLRWPMVDQAWQPILWLSLAAALAALIPLSMTIRRLVFSGVVAAAVMSAVAVSIGYNAVQTSRSATESALRSGTTEALKAIPAERAVNVLILVKPGVELAVPDVMSSRIASVWFPGRDVGMRILTKGAQVLEPSHDAWWRVRFAPDQAENIRIGGGASSYEALRVLSFDGVSVVPLARLRSEDIDGYPATWERTGPVDLRVGP
jgi:hypothetical protein